jgi:hypothetical protein
MSFLKNSVKFMAETAVGSVALKGIEDSGMSSGFKSATSSMVGIGLLGSAYNKFGKTKKGDWL